MLNRNAGKMLELTVFFGYTIGVISERALCGGNYFGRTVCSFHVCNVRHAAGMIRGLCIYRRAIFKICRTGLHWTGRLLFKNIAAGCCREMGMNISALKNFRITTVFCGITDVLHTITDRSNALHIHSGIICSQVNGVGMIMQTAVRG